MNITCEGYGIRLKWQDDRTATRSRRSNGTGRQPKKVKTTSLKTKKKNLSIPTSPPSLPTPPSTSFIANEQYSGSNSVTTTQHAVVVKSPINNDHNVNKGIPATTLPTPTSPFYTVPQNENSSSHSILHSDTLSSASDTQPYYKLTSGNSSTSASTCYTFQPPLSTGMPTPTSSSVSSSSSVTTSNNSYPPHVTDNHHHNSVKTDNPTLKQALADGTENLLLNHFTNVMATELTVINTFSNNIYKKVICPLYQNDDSLRFALCGLSARQLAQYYSAYSSMSVEFKVEALKALRQKLTWHDLDLPSLSTIVTLALHEVYEGNAEIWKKHIEGAVHGALSSKNGRESESLLSQSNEDSNVRRMMYILEYHDIMSSLVSRTKPAMYGRFTLPWNYEDEKSADSSFLATVCPLYRAASAISLLAYELQSSGDGGLFIASDSSLWPSDLATKIQDVQYMLSIWSPYSESMQCDALNTSYVLKYATNLYFLMKLDATEFSKLDHSKNVKSIVKEAMNCFRKISLQSSCNVCHPWPLWQVGIMCEDEADQQLIVARLEQLKWRSNKMSIQTIIDFLYLLWGLRKDASYASMSFRDLLQETSERTPALILL